MSDIVEPIALIDLRNLAMAGVVGFLIGFEREWTHAAEARERQFAGARTFTLVALLGGLAGLFAGSELVLVAGFIAVAALTTAGYWASTRDPESRRGGTTEVAVLAAYLLGAAATHGHILLASVGGVSVAIVLSIKDSIERAAAALSERELRATLRFLAISIIVLPVLPNEGFGPYDALNPREIWLMVVFISGLSFIGYWLMKFFGASKGVLFTGIVGGLASSTATTLSLANLAREGEARGRSVAAGIVLANVIMLARVGLLLAAASPGVLVKIAPALAGAGLAGLLAALFLSRTGKHPHADESTIALGNPMEIRAALVFAALLAIISLVSRFGADYFGERALYAVGFLSGLADVDAVTLTAGRQAAAAEISLAAASGAVLAAIASNIIIKGAMAASIGGATLGRPVVLAFAGVLVIGGIVWAVG